MQILLRIFIYLPDDHDLIINLFNAVWRNLIDNRSKIQPTLYGLRAYVNTF